MQSLATFARAAAPFWTVYAGTVLVLDGALIGGLSFAFLASDTVSNVIWGPMGDRHGFKRVFAGSLGCTLAGVLCLFFGTSAVRIYAAFVLLGFGGSGWMLASTTMVLEFGQPQDTPMRLAFLTTVEGAIAAAGPVLAGILVAFYGFTPLFAIVLGAVALSLVLLAWRVREPREG